MVAWSYKQLPDKIFSLFSLANGLIIYVGHPLDQRLHYFPDNTGIYASQMKSGVI